jgi:very-short-patch-repair endonuclease
VLHRHPGRPGTRALRRILDGGLHRTRSRPERDLAALCAAARLPAPELNARVAGLEVDAHWPEHGVVVEVDTLGTHGHATAFVADHRRDLELQAAGIAILRVTDHQLAHDRPAVTAVLAATLARRG